ncbi:MAG: winged helix-turn-helix domain-containing protein, partial [Bacteroidota bacterium]
MFPYKTSIQLDRKSHQALFLQLANQMIQHIKSQTLAPETKLPSSRVLADQLQVHRKTVVACYEELTLQGWVESLPKKGTFVRSNLPVLEQQKLYDFTGMCGTPTTGFSFYGNPMLGEKAVAKQQGVMYINDGVSDARLTPID